MSEDRTALYATFARCFRSFGGCSVWCSCNKTYYSSNETYDWEEGEMEHMEQSDHYICVGEYAVEGLEFQGETYVSECNCWHPVADKFINFMDEYEHHVDEYLRSMRDQKRVWNAISKKD